MQKMLMKKNVTQHCAATATLLADVMPCDPHCTSSLPALPGENVPHSHSMVSAELATSSALLSMVVHVATGRREARHIVFAQVAMLHTCNAARHALQMCLDATRHERADMVTGSQKTTMHMCSNKMLRMCSLQRHVAARCAAAPCAMRAAGARVYAMGPGRKTCH